MSQPAEISVIGAVLLDGSAYDRVAHWLAPVDFEDRRHRAIWQAIDAMAQAGESIDAMLVSERLERDGRLDLVGGWSYVMQCAQDTPSAANVEHYARQVHDAAALRHLAALCRDLAGKCVQPGAEADSLAMEAETRIHKLATAKHAVQEMRPLRDVMLEAVRYVDDRQNGAVSAINVGLPKLDRMFGGLLRGSMTVVAARPSQGKTALGLTMALGAVREHGHKAAFISIEMPAWQVGVRLMCMAGQIPVQDTMQASLTDYQWARLTAQMSELTGSGLYVADSSEVSIPALRAMVSRQKRTTGLDLVVVDYLQLMAPPKIESREQQVAALSRGLRAVAKEFDVAVVVLAQLNREATGRRPRMSDIRESGAVEQDADVVMLIHREDKDGQPADTVDLIIDKNRNGETGVVVLSWIAEQTRFAEFQAAAYSGMKVA